jgi:hypothetical protein
MKHINLSYFEYNLPFFERIFRYLRLVSPPPDYVLTPHNKSFILKKSFQDGYLTAIKNIGRDYRIPWRVHQAQWAAHHCLSIEGAFVEIGTGRGFIMQTVLGSIEDWNSINKQIHLFDSFQKHADTGLGKAAHDEYYADGIDDVKKNFQSWERVFFHQGDVRDTIKNKIPPKISFLHVDLNSAETELEILDLIFSSISTNGIILLDDYANRGEEYAYELHNSFFESRGHHILTTPSGQGIIIKK